MRQWKIISLMLRCLLSANNELVRYRFVLVGCGSVGASPGTRQFLLKTSVEAPWVHGFKHATDRCIGRAPAAPGVATVRQRSVVRRPRSDESHRHHSIQDWHYPLREEHGTGGRSVSKVARRRNNDGRLTVLGPPVPEVSISIPHSRMATPVCAVTRLDDGGGDSPLSFQLPCHALDRHSRRARVLWIVASAD